MSSRSEVMYAKNVEKYANILHELWMEWTKYICREQYYSIPTHIRNFWSKNWIPYDKLPEHEKEKDRKYARRFMELLER